MDPEILDVFKDSYQVYGLEKVRRKQKPISVCIEKEKGAKNRIMRINI